MDALVHIARYHIPIEWRLCARDPECEEWEEYERYGNTQEGEDVWGTPAEKHPCYNWLDTDEPKRHGWTAEQIAETDRNDRWKVVPFYSTDPRASRMVMRHSYMSGCAAWVECDGHTGFHAGCTNMYGRFEAEGDTEDHAICRAFLKSQQAKP